MQSSFTSPMASLSREATASLLNWSTLLTSSPAALLDDGQSAHAGCSAAGLQSCSRDVTNTANESSSPHLSYQLSDDDRLHQHFSDQLDQYKRELATLQERAQQIVTENTTLRLEASSLSSRQPVPQSTTPRRRAAGPPGSRHVRAGDEPRRMDQSRTTDPPELEDRSDRRQTKKHAKLDPMDSRVHAKGTGTAVDKGCESEPEDSAVPSRKRPSPRSSPDSRGTFLSEAQSRKENERLSKSLEDANKQLTQRLQEVLKLDTRLSVQDENYKTREAEIKANIPSLCLECRHRKALLPQPISTEHQRTIAGLERERDDALAWLKKLRDRLGELQQKEAVDQRHMQSTRQHAKLTEDANEQMKLEVSQLQGALRKKESDCAASLQAMRSTTESAMRSHEAQWQKQQEELCSQVHRFQTAEIASNEEIAKLTRTNNRVQAELRAEQQLRHTEAEHFKKRGSQLDSELTQVQANQLKQKLVHDTITNDLGARNTQLEKNLAEVQHQLSAQSSQIVSLQQFVETNRAQCLQLELEVAQCKQDLMRKQLSYASALQDKDTEGKRIAVEKHSQLEEAALTHDHFAMQSSAMEADLRQQVKTEKETSCHWKCQYRDVKERMNTDIEELRAKLSSRTASVASLIRERDAAVNDASLLAAEVKAEGKRRRKLEATSKQSETDSQHWKQQVHTLLQKQRQLMLERRNLSHQLELTLMKPSQLDGALTTATVAGNSGSPAGAVFQEIGEGADPRTAT